jgi:phenylacetate-CoA ligase
MPVEIPYYWQSVDWDRLIADYPPPPMFAETTGRMAPGEVRRLQEERFLARVNEAWALPFYNDRWRAVGLEPGDVASLDDITKIPMFTSDDLRLSHEERPPFGTHHPFGNEGFGHQPLKVQTSGGTTGRPRATLFDPIAWEVLGIQGARAMYAAGARAGDVVQIPFTNGLNIGGWAGFVAAFNWLGCVPLTSGSGIVTPSELQLEYARDFGTNGWWISSEYAGRLVEVAKSMGLDLHQLPTRFIVSSLGPDVDGIYRRQLEEAWNAPVYDRYGTHEIGQVGFDCSLQNGMHISHDTVYIEIVDVDSGEVVPFGTDGNLVATSLHRSVPPFIRYNLRDLFRMSPAEPCGCGLHTAKLSSFLGRSDEMVKLRGQNLYPMACQPIVTRNVATTGQYLCVVRHIGSGVDRRTTVTVQVERRSTEVDAEGLEKTLRAEFHRDLGVRVDVEIVDPGALAEVTGVAQLGERKLRRLLDLRDKPGGKTTV